MSLIIGFDLSLSSTGVCVLPADKDTPIHYESISSDLEGIERLEYNYHRYLNLLTTYKGIEYIAFEEQNQQMRFSYNAGSILSLAENVGVFKLALSKSLPFLTVPPVVIGVPAQDIKKFATSNGKATKEEMIAAVNGNHIKSIRKSIPEHSINDVCDAYHLAKLVKNLVSSDSDYSKYIVKNYRSSEE